MRLFKELRRVGFFCWWIEEGESPENAFHREAKEELGLDMSLFDYRYLWEYIFEFPERIAYWNIFIIKTTLKQDDFTVYEWAWAKYFSLEDARKLKFPSNPDIYIDIVEKFIKNNK